MTGRMTVGCSCLLMVKCLVLFLEIDITVSRFLTSFSWTFKARTRVTMLAHVLSTSVFRVDCEFGRYSLSCSGIRRRNFAGTPACFEWPESVHGEFTHDLRSDRRASSGYSLQLHGVREENHRSR